MSTRASLPVPDTDRLQSATRRAAWVLRVSVALLALGLAAAILPIFNMFGDTSQLNSLLVIDNGANEELAATVDQIAAVVLLVTAAGILITRHAWWLLPLIPVWLLVNAAYQIRHTVWHPELILPSSALRVLAPVALLILVSRGSAAITRRRAAMVEWLLRLSIAATFAGHGLEALFQRGHFVDLIVMSADNTLGWRIAEPDARTLLAIVGSVDMLVALLILVPTRQRLLVIWLAFWGLLTAASRITHQGNFTHLDDTLVRLVHGGAPLALLVWWSTHVAPRSAAEPRPAGSAADPDAGSDAPDDASTQPRTDP